MDLIWGGMAVLACSLPKNKVRNPYATMTRLKPDRCWPDVTNGSIEDLVYIERVRLRNAARRYPSLGPVEPDNTDMVELMDYYNDESVTRAVIHLGNKGSDSNQAVDVRIVDQWMHGLDCVPIAFAQLDSIDEAFRGMLDQVAPGLLSRNRIFQYLMDYIYDMVHAPYEEKNIRNWSDPPGPDTVYHHDPSDPNSFIRRVAPAAPAPAVFGIAQYMEGQASGELVQPPSRQGDVRQSVASASFVGATQGRLTTLVKDLHDNMSDLRMQASHITQRIEVEHLDFKKPLYYPVEKKRSYKPSTDIGDWYHMKFTFGVAAGVDRATADQRLIAARGTKAISLRTYRDQLEYVDDPGAEQRIIDLEDTQDAFKQRILLDPRFPLSVVANIMKDLKMEGDTLIESAIKYIPELQAADQAAQQGGTPTAPEGQVGAPPEEVGIGGAQPPTNGPNAIVPPTEGQPPQVQLPGNPMVQQFLNSGG